MAKKNVKNSSLSEKLSSLIQTKPKVYESDEEENFTTIDKIAFSGNESDYSADELGVTQICRLNTKYLDEEDSKYHSKGISRKDLAGSESDELEEDELLERSNSGNEYSNEEDSENSQSGSEDEDDNESDSNEIPCQTSKELGNNEVDVNKELFLRAAKDLEKGKAIKTQLLIWDFLLDCRMKFQGCLMASNQLPNYKNYPKYKCNTQFDELSKQAKKSLKHLLKSLLSLQEIFLSSNNEFIKSLKNEKCSGANNDNDSDNDDDSIINSDFENDETTNKSKHLLKLNLFSSQFKNLSDFSREMSKRHKNFENYRNNTIQKWDDKTRLSYISSKNFGAFEQSALKQIDQILMDKQRLLTRTQMKRSNYTILGSEKDEPPKKQAKLEDETKANCSQKNKTLICKEIFDDDDFYHQLLSELIKRKASSVTDPVQLGRQWMQLQKIRSKMKKNVDTKATKARKVRFVVHQKLVNFMMPTFISMGNENARIELINSLFGKKK